LHTEKWKAYKLLVPLKLRRLTFKLHLLQSYFGANVLHPRTISPVIRYGIPIIIRNVFNTSASGTKICHPSIIENEDRKILTNFVKGFTTIDNLALVNVEG
jgi:aspartokinase/homoserine dehydrogenase 1